MCWSGVVAALVAVMAVVAGVDGQIVFPGDEPRQPSVGPTVGDSNTRRNLNRHGGSSGGGGNDAIFFPRNEEKNVPLCTTYKGEQGNCRLLVQCTTFFAEIAELSRSPCTINGNQQGVCCPPTKNPVAVIEDIIRKPAEGSVAVPDVINTQALNHACQKGIDKLHQKEAFVDQLFQNNIIPAKGTPADLHGKLFQTTNKIVQKNKKAEMSLEASINLVQSFNLSKVEGGSGLPKFGVQGTIIADTCEPEPICPETKYRAYDAKCNNLRNKDWGSAGYAFNRILPAVYEDGVNSPREKSVLGGPLPNPRHISSGIILDQNQVYDNYTILIMQWGQFLDHDMTHTPLTKGKNMVTISCCKGGQKRPARELHDDCLPIEIPSHDSFYSRHNQHCMDFVRSMCAPRPKCNFGPREQMNQITAFIDASNVYGSNHEEAGELREFQGGLMKVANNNGEALLPPDRSTSGCTDASRKFHCFKAGDSRVNEQPELAVTHTLWVRQHNRIAVELAGFNPGWNDEVVFQETRRIVAAQMQHITYHEYLPIVLGREFMEAFGLVPQTTGYSPGYRQDIDPTINNAFATAAFRYGHTLISGTMEGYSKFGTVNRELRLSKHQFSPFVLYQPGGVDSLLRGLSIQPSQKFDHFFSDELTNHLFAHNQPFGMDLVALNIQRGRDHGLPGYTKWREICNLPPVRDFDQLRDVMEVNMIEQLKSLYSHVDDIDLFIGGIAENPSGRSLLGYTFLCIVGDQFARLRLGDRFYYENGGLESSFSEAQLDEIRKTTMSRVLCDNSEDLDMMQPYAFGSAHLLNKRALCKFGNLIPKMSLAPWRNEPVWV